MPIPTTILIILDGFGSNPSPVGNAILNTPTPNLDFLWNNYPHTLLKAAEEEVGVAFGQPGNSEVGHLSIGSGRVLFQSLPRINNTISDGSFYKNSAFIEACNHTKRNNSTLHLLGMVSTTGVHSHLDHYIALMKLAWQQKIKNLALHLILDGRDTGPRDAPIFLEHIQQAIKEYGGAIATISGRAYTMDRNNNWERTYKAFATITGQLAPNQEKEGSDPSKIIQDSYQQGLDDETILPTLINPSLTLKNNDALIFANFREDRARQMTKILLGIQPLPTNLTLPANLKIVTMTEYEKGLPALVAFPPEKATNTLSDVLEVNGITQAHIAETEKYAHVSYFFNGGRESPNPHEKHLQVTSPKPETFVSKPQMAAPQVLDLVTQSIQTKQYQFIVVNFANPDMIAHTGNYEATRTAISIIDDCVGKIYTQINAINGNLALTADHGNAESMLDEQGQPTKDHTASPVPFILATPTNKLVPPENNRVTLGAQVTGILADVAPTILNTLGLPIPTEMTGTSLF